MHAGGAPAMLRQIGKLWGGGRGAPAPPYLMVPAPAASELFETALEAAKRGTMEEPKSI
jgi:hypothetical protein